MLGVWGLNDWSEGNEPRCHLHKGWIWRLRLVSPWLTRRGDESLAEGGRGGKVTRRIG